jgi:putative selenium metabolism protein SsnA
MKIQVITNAALVPFGKESVLPSGAVAWNRDGILAIGSPESIRRQYSEAGTIDAQGQMVTPGLINLHTHLYSTLARGLTPPEPAPTTFPEILSSFWWKWDKCLDLDNVKLSAELGLLDCLSCGVTTVFDHHSSPNAVRGSLERIGGAYREIGLRGSLCYEVSDRDGSQVAQKAIQENLAFAESINGSETGLLTSHFGLHASFTLSDDTLKEVATHINHRDIGIHIHLSEDNSDNQIAASLGYSSPAERLNRFGLLNEKNLLIHGVHLKPDQWDIIRGSGSHIIHCPASNLNNAVGIAPISDMLEKGLSVGLGTDGYGANMLSSANLAALLAKHKTADPREGTWPMSLLTEANPRIASIMMNKAIGVLKPGAVADIVLWDYVPATPLTNDTAPGHLLFGVQNAKPIRIWVDGDMVWDNGHAVRIDKDSVIREARKRVPELWKRFRQ